VQAALSMATLGSVAAIGRDLSYARNLSDTLQRWVAAPPDGFVPDQRPGLVVAVEKRSDFASLMQPNLLWPKADIAKAMLTRALTELSGESTLPRALGRFIHSDDRVAIKVNGISGQKGHTMAVNYELILPLVEALIELGVAGERITLFEQFPDFLAGTRLTVDGYPLPRGVSTTTHDNRHASMPEVAVWNRTKTRYVKPLTDATAVINMTTIKDHHLCGMTGALKNLTHGQIVNPHDHHAMGCDPQIPLLYNFPVLRSRVRLHIADAFKLIYDLGPLDREPTRRIPHGVVYASTDPVALDTVGQTILDDARHERGLPSMAKAGRDPSYIRTAGEIGLGIADLNAIRWRRITL
jgi:hypothetical protein